jgi:hypothetical protein
MPIKLSYNHVFNVFAKEGYKLLSKNYVNSREKVEFICPNGHTHSITLSAFTNQGQRCSICSKRKKHNLQEIKDIFNNVGWKLLSTVYINNKQVLDVLCNKGHKISINLNNFLNGWRCKKCYVLRNRGETSNCWNPNLTNEERLRERDIPENNDWIKNVLKRDNYKCVYCNTDGNGTNLNAHHLEGWHWCKTLRFEVSNGVTLCKDCHKAFHKQFGRKYNTSEQFYIFLRTNHD